MVDFGILEQVQERWRLEHRIYAAETTGFVLSQEEMAQVGSYCDIQLRFGRVYKRQS